MSQNTGNLGNEHLFLKDVTKSFSGRGTNERVIAVDKVSLAIREGEFITLLGPSGCGKTTTLRLIAGFESPTAGQIILDGADVSHIPPNHRDMALVFQNYALFPHMTVYNNVAYGLQAKGTPRAAIKERVRDALEQVELTKLENRRPNELSGGQQQRVALARSLVMEPRVLLFDEPLSNLDAKLRVQMRREILRIQRQKKITSIYVTHDQVEAMALSDRIVVMNNGHIEQIGTPDQIYRHPVSRFVADFIGRVNFIETKVEKVSSGQVTVRLLNQPVNIPTILFSENQNLTAVIRPEGLKLKEDASLPQATIQQVMYLGSEIEYLVEVDHQSLIVVETDPRVSQIFNAGKSIGLEFVAEAVHLITA